MFLWDVAGRPGALAALLVTLIKPVVIGSGRSQDHPREKCGLELGALTFLPHPTCVPCETLIYRRSLLGLFTDGGVA